MANELTINLPTITYIKSPFSESLAPGVLQVTVNGKQVVHGSIGLSTADLTLNKGNIGTYGYIYFRNQDNTNNVQIGSDGTLFGQMLKPGEAAVVRWNAAAVHAKSVAGAPILEYWAVED
jgi:hypothetical protein